MAIKFFEDGVSDEDIPLLKDYLRMNPELDQVYVVRKFVETLKGILVFTDAFKGTIWKNQECYNDLEEAVKVLPKILEDAPTFVVQPLSTGKMRIGVDEARAGEIVWKKTSDISTEARPKTPKSEEVVRSNRFLAPSQKPLLEIKVSPVTEDSPSQAPAPNKRARKEG